MGGKIGKVKEKKIADKNRNINFFEEEAEKPKVALCPKNHIT